MRYIFRPQETADGIGANTAEFEFRELEININAYLNPYMRGDVFIGIHGTEGPVDVEEASMTVLRGIPLSIQLKVGKYLLDFGEINAEHPHQWAWLEFPLMHRTMLGEEGLRTVGAQLTTLQALGDNAITLSFNAFSSTAFEHEHAGKSEPETGGAAPEIMYSGRLSWFRQLSDAWSGEAGVSALSGEYDPHEGLNTNVANFEMKLRWRPSAYTAFVWIVESMYSDRETATPAVGDTTGMAPPNISSVSAAGVFTTVDYQFRKRWDVGGFFDFTQDAEIPDAETTAWGAFFGFMPAEETARISLVYRNEISDLYDFTDNSLTIQFLWALGPHRPHTF